MRILVIGAVAAGTSAAAKARRNSEDIEITVYEKDRHISYSGCGMPYYIGRHVDKAEQLYPRDPAYFKTKYNVEIRILHEVLSIRPADHSIIVKDLTTGEVFSDTYDKLILATGAASVIHPIPGIEKSHVFSLRSIADMHKIAAFIQTSKPQEAAIIGTGFIGMEMCENLTDIGIQVTMIEKLPQVTPGLDEDMAIYVQDRVESKGVRVMTDTVIEKIEDHKIVLSDGHSIPADLVIAATGVRPNTSLAHAAGIVLGPSGAIQVNPKMETNIPNIYACGDCVEQMHLITRKPVYRPLGSSANKTGRIAGDAASGGSLESRGILGTGIFKIFDLTVAQTGLSEREALQEGYDIAVSHNIKPDRPEYMGGRDIIIKAIADKSTDRILGVQIIGENGVDKRIDVFVTAMTFGAKAEDLFHLDLAYAPPYSTTKDPVMYTGMILDNAIHRGRPLISAGALDTLIQSRKKIQLFDVRSPAQYLAEHIETAVNIPQEKLRERISALDKEAITITYCNKGVTGNAAQNILINKGFKSVYNISGGNRTYRKMKDTQEHLHRKNGKS
jgi:NADPH-dependent 2,4-dienoyl-CoA reductase/sulfur reductase-like enzyme/rhodanese-related sulfurtransferase